MTESTMESKLIVDSSMFNALQNIDIDNLDSKQVNYVLPFLAKLLLNPSFIKRQQLLKLLYPIKKMNDVIELLTTRQSEILELTNQSLPLLASTFESSSNSDRLKIVAAEYIKIQEQARQANFNANPSLKFQQSDLFDNINYIDNISICLSALVMRATANPMINILDMCEALLHVKHGSAYIIRLVANMPDRCQEVCHTLITFGERQDEGATFNEVSEQRAQTLRILCLMNPSIAFSIRAATLQMCKMPSLTIMITLDHLKNALGTYSAIVEDEEQSTETSEDKMDLDETKNKSQALKELENCFDNAIAFVTGILLGVDETTRVWFSQYTKMTQLKRIDQGHHCVFSEFRTRILAYMNHLFPTLLEEEYMGQQADELSTTDNSESKISLKDLNRKLIRATATLKLFCALRGIGAIKLNPDESEILLRLITCKPSVNQTSVNFATTGVCTLLACSALINNQKEEKRAAEWLKWLIKESNYSDNRYTSHGKCSISELLLLIAIHFQNNQTSQIAELVCATLDMKLQIKPSVSKCKSLFVQEVFNDQMVAEHAVKVPVTKSLNNNITEFLPVHCIHQLLESRSFSKHQLPINNWIYRQICESRKPIHNILPKLIEAYVNSVIVSSSIHGHCGTNQPISEEQLSRVFKIRLYSVESDTDFNSVVENKPKTNNNHVKHDRKRVKKEKVVEPKEVSEELKDVVQSDEDQPEIVDVEAAQVLLLYYLVLYDDLRLRKNGDLSSSERSKLLKYSPDFMMEIPVFYLLQLVRDNQNSFAAILPDLLKLVTSQYPQLCSIQHWLTFDNCKPHGSEGDAEQLVNRIKELSTAKFTTKVSKGTNVAKVQSLSTTVSSSNAALKPIKRFNENLMKQLSDGFRDIQKNYSSLIRTMSHILILPKEEIWPYVDVFIENLSKIIGSEVSDTPEYRRLISITTKLWWKFNIIFPRKLWVMTVNALKRPQNCRMGLNDVKPVEHSWDELAQDPLIVLRCDSKVFRCEATLNIVLHILSAFLAASGRCLQDQIDELPSRHKDLQSLEVMKSTLIMAQTSAAIQILLESCIPIDEESMALSKRDMGHELTQCEKLLLGRLDASVNCICEHLHQVFIADTNLAKLVHFQTYRSELLSTTSSKIPSMHICLDFIPELLSQPDLTKQVFVIELTSHLCERYAITKSLNVAKLCFNVAYTLLQLLPSERRALFFIPVLPALIRICKVFPILREDADIILTQINQITLAHMASTSSRLSLRSARPFEGLEKMSWREIKKLMSTLSLHEALYLCIQKCCLDLTELKDSSSDEQSSRLNIGRQAPVPVPYNTIFAYGNHVIDPTTS